MALSFEFARVSRIRAVWILAFVTVATNAAMALFSTMMAKDVFSAADLTSSLTSTVVVALTRGPLAGTLAFVIGALIACADLRSGAAFTAFTLIPRRHSLFFARITVCTTVVVTTAVISLAVNAGLTALTLGTDTFAGIEVSTALRCAVGFTVLCVGLGALGAGVGMIVGSPLAAIGGGVLWFAVAEPAIRAGLLTMSGSSAAGIAEFLPLAAGNSMINSLTGDGTSEATLTAVTPLTGAAVFTVTVIVVTGVGWLRFRARPIVASS